MSRIFDALKWAEGQRRKTTPTVEDPLPVEGEPRPAAPLRAVDIPKDFMRELGILRNSIDAVFTERRKRTLLFTSATHGEGTTTVATSFARFLALEGQSGTLVCELNARSPAFSRVFSINGDEGATDYFNGDASLASLVKSPGESEMDVLHVGREDPTLIQLNLHHAFPRLIEEATRTYDTVIIDAPPVLSCPETPPMSSHVDGVVLVVHAGKTKREVVARSLETIDKFHGNVLGVVLNRKKYYIPEFLYKRI